MLDRNAIRRLLQPLATRIKLSSSRGVVRLVNDSTPVQSLQIERLRGEVSDGVERFQEYGFTSHPQVGSEVAVLSLNGDRSHPMIVALEDRRYRIELAEGQVAVYDAAGSKIVLDNAGNATVTASGSVTIDAPSATVKGDLAVDGDVVAGGDVSDATGTIQVMRDVFNAHTHPETGGTTGPPAVQQV
ncbi:MAG: phage baseplate assembly protein V [Planctomycetota bacterium]